MGFCNDITPTCDVCFETAYGQCGDVLEFNLGLGAVTTYYLNLIDKFDIITQTTVITDAFGNFTLTQTWTQFTGSIEIQIFTDAARLNQLTFSQGGIDYDCIVMSLGVGGVEFCSNKLNFQEECNSQYVPMF